LLFLDHLDALVYYELVPQIKKAREGNRLARLSVIGTLAGLGKVLSLSLREDSLAIGMAT
jgi:uncharacterized membrane protein YjfL (UPF0719 family)